jgi:hypothetical protein
MTGEMLTVGRVTVELSNTTKVLLPGDGITKGDLVEYYQVRKEGGSLRQVVCDKPATIVYLANQACIELHAFLSRLAHIDQPDQLIFDLDPPDGDRFADVRVCALRLRELLAGELGLPAFVKTTGGNGLHVHVPLNARQDFDTVREFARQAAELLAARNPDLAATEQRRAVTGMGTADRRRDIKMTVLGNQAPSGGDQEVPAGQLVKQLSEQVSRLVREEVKLATLEMTGKAKTAARGAGLFGGSGVVALYGTGCLLAAAIIALAGVMPPWLAALIVGVALFAVAGIAALAGKGQFKKATPPMPSQAAESVKADVDQIKESAHR